MHEPCLQKMHENVHCLGCVNTDRAYELDQAGEKRCALWAAWHMSFFRPSQDYTAAVLIVARLVLIIKG
jgi:hypothetical protein